MTDKKFIYLVFQMRSAQTEYFATGSKVCLAKAKNFERLVDQAIDEAMNVPIDDSQNGDYGFDFESQDER